MLVFFTNMFIPPGFSYIDSMEVQPIQFFTATVLKWIPILNNDVYKDIIINSLSFLVKNKRVKVYGFVIMPNHIHLIWQVQEGYELKNVQRDFLRFTSQQIQKDLRTNHPKTQRRLEVNLKDRKYQLWQRNPLSIDLFSREMIEQKLEYIHHNPVQAKWQLVDDFVNYTFSSASYYEEDDTSFDFLSHYMEYLGW